VPFFDSEEETEVSRSPKNLGGDEDEIFFRIFRK
jgi:hypothetical protein